MGIVNVTPDSFSDGGQFLAVDDAVARAAELVAAGADVIDIGGESTRPGAAPVSVQQELDRVIPVIERLRGFLDVAVSIDTTKSEVARSAMNSGADIINDISGMTFDPDMATVAAETSAGCALMHTTGKPQVMMVNPLGTQVTAIVRGALRASADWVMRCGVSHDKIALDPGFAFGKTVDGNYALLAELSDIAELGFPVMVGMSRKSMLKRIVGEDAEAIEHATTAANVAALLAGAHILRVHNVTAARAASGVCLALQRAQSSGGAAYE